MGRKYLGSPARTAARAAWRLKDPIDPNIVRYASVIRNRHGAFLRPNGTLGRKFTVAKVFTRYDAARRAVEFYRIKFNDPHLYVAQCKLTLEE